MRWRADFFRNISSTQYFVIPTPDVANSRRNQSGAIRFIPALKAVLLCSLIGGSCVGYVAQKNKIFELGQQIGARQQRLEKLKKDNQDLTNRLALMQRPQYLAERVKQLNLGLVPPQPSQTIWIAEPLPQQKPITNAIPLEYVQFKP